MPLLYLVTKQLFTETLMAVFSKSMPAVRPDSAAWAAACRSQADCPNLHAAAAVGRRPGRRAERARSAPADPGPQSAGKLDAGRPVSVRAISRKNVILSVAKDLSEE